MDPVDHHRRLEATRQRREAIGIERRGCQGTVHRRGTFHGMIRRAEQPAIDVRLFGFACAARGQQVRERTRPHALGRRQRLAREVSLHHERDAEAVRVREALAEPLLQKIHGRQAGAVRLESFDDRGQRARGLLHLPFRGEDVRSLDERLQLVVDHPQLSRQVGSP